jgi:transketolase
MITKKKSEYESPRLEVEVMVYERGFASSFYFDQIEDAFKKARECKGKPTAIVQKSTKGKGVSFMENQVSWHGSAPNAEQYQEAMAELDAKLKELEA